MILVFYMIGHIAYHSPQKRDGRSISQRTQEIDKEQQANIGRLWNTEQCRKESRKTKTELKGLALAKLISQILRQADNTHKLHNGPHHIKHRESYRIGILWSKGYKVGQEIVERPLINIILEIEVHCRSPHGQRNKQREREQCHGLPRYARHGVLDILADT